MRERSIYKYAVMFLLAVSMIMSSISVVSADEIAETGDTDQGHVSGSNVYTYYYRYNAQTDSIELKVVTERPIRTFGNSTTHTFTSAEDDIVLNTQNPRLGSSLDSALSDMIRRGGYDMTVAEAKEQLREMGYYDNGNGIWKVSGGYLTFVSAGKIRKKTHTVAYDANGGTGAPDSQRKKQGQTLTLRSGKPTREGYSFQNWKASIGGTYNPGGSYTHDQDGGTVTMRANWKDETGPDCSDLIAKPNHWSAGNGSVTFHAQDEGSGISSITLERYSFVTRTWSTVKSWSCGGTKDMVYGSYTESSEGVFYYMLTVRDKDGNSSVKTSRTIYLDHSAPVLYGMENTVSDWTNTAPVIAISATDYLYGTTYNGSGLASIVIKDDSGNIVASGNERVRYELADKYEGIHTWNITGTDNVGHTVSATVSTKYDITPPGMDGTEVTHVEHGITYSGYCQDNIISQHIDDEARRSPNHPNCTSGLSSVIVYKVKNEVMTAIYSSTTQKTWGTPDTHSSFDVYYDINPTNDHVDYYLVIARDFAGNTETKKLTSQRTLLKLFHTSIDRSTYEHE